MRTARYSSPGSGNLSRAALLAEAEGPGVREGAVAVRAAVHDELARQDLNTRNA